MCQFLVVNEYDVHLYFHCVKLNKGRLRCTEIICKYELISDVSFKTSLNPEIQFSQEQRNHAKFTRNALVWFFAFSLTYSWHWNKPCVHCSTQSPIFIFLTSILRYMYQRFMSFYKALPLYQLFSFWIMFGMHFDNVSVYFELHSCCRRPFSDVKR